MKLKLVKKNDVQRSDKDLDTICEFIDFCGDKLSMEGDVKVCLNGKGTGDTGISTGGYDRVTNDISTREHGRSLVDMLRSIAHELVHQRQRETGKIGLNEDIPNIGGEIEDEANALSGQLVKMYVDEHDGRWLYQH